MKFWPALVALLLAGPAWADMFPDGSNAKLPTTGTPVAAVCRDAGGKLLSPVGGCPSISTGTPASGINSAIAAAIASGAQGVQLQAGATYDVAATGTDAQSYAYSLLISGATNFVFDCNGATVRYSTTSLAAYTNTISVQNGSNVAFRDCLFDWTNLPYTQATVTAIGATTADFTIDPTYPVWWGTFVQQIEEFTPSTVAGVPATWVKPVFSFQGGNRTMTSLGGNVYRVDFSADAAGLALLVLNHSYLLTAKVHVGSSIYPFNVDGLTLDGVQTYASGMAYRFWSSRNLRAINQSGARLKPGTTRWRSANADVFHWAFGRGPAIIDNAFVQSTGDDAINVYGVLYNVSGITDTTHFNLAGVPPPGQTPLVGDILQFVDPNGVVQGTAPVASANVVGSNYVIVTSSPAPGGFATTWKVADQSAVPSSLRVSNGRFEYIRGHGVVSQSPNTAVVGNQFYNLRGTSGLFFNNASYFAQGPVPSGVQIIGNVSEGNNLGTSPVGGEPGDWQFFSYSLDGTTESPAGTISKLTFTGNTCRNTNNMCLYVAGASKVSVTNNTFDLWGQNPNGVAWHGLGPYAIGMYNVSGVRYGGNAFTSAGTNRFIAAGTNSDVASVTPLNFQGGSANVTTTAGGTIFVGGGNFSANRTSVAFQVPVAGVSGTFQCYSPTAPGVGKSVTFTVEKQGSATAQTCVISDANSQATGTGSVSFNARDLFDISVALTAAGTPSTVSYSLIYDVP